MPLGTMFRQENGSSNPRAGDSLLLQVTPITTEFMFDALALQQRRGDEVNDAEIARAKDQLRQMKNRVGGAVGVLASRAWVPELPPNGAGGAVVPRRRIPPGEKVMALGHVGYGFAYEDAGRVVVGNIHVHPLLRGCAVSAVILRSLLRQFDPKLELAPLQEAEAAPVTSDGGIGVGGRQLLDSVSLVMQHAFECIDTQPTTQPPQDFVRPDHLTVAEADQLLSVQFPGLDDLQTIPSMRPISP